MQLILFFQNILEGISDSYCSSKILLEIFLGRYAIAIVYCCVIKYAAELSDCNAKLHVVPNICQDLFGQKLRFDLFVLFNLFCIRGILFK
jgi:hypothetical protein